MDQVVLAVDGGGTKTHCLVGALDGRVLGTATGGPSNYQTVGRQVAADSLHQVIINALTAAARRLDEVAFAYFGLAGADFPEDLAVFNSIIKAILGSRPFKVVNDAWLALLSACPDGWGAALICGTGANAVAHSPSGLTAALRSQDYRLGNYGGGQQLIDDALHFAFRADEQTGRPTRLTEEIPSLFGVSDMEAVFRILYKPGEPSYTEPPSSKVVNELPALLFRLAAEGDEVCQDILVRMGSELGALAAGTIERAGLSGLVFTIGFMGSLFQKAATPILFDAALLRIHRTAPYAQAVIPREAPVFGALAGAMREAAARG